jgi:ankyrin repeat protein
VDVATPDGSDANHRLLAAAALGDLDAIRVALADGATPDARDPDGTPATMLATRGHHTDALLVLLDAGADVDAQDATLDNPLLYAAREGFLDITRLANEAEADPTITNRYGGVAHIPASERGHVEVVRYLLDETDIDVDHVNRLGWTALLEAIVLSDGGPRHQEIVRLLLEAGADPDLADADGVRPLAHARSRGQTAIARLLEEADARP